MEAPGAELRNDGCQDTGSNAAGLLIFYNVYTCVFMVWYEYMLYCYVYICMCLWYGVNICCIDMYTRVFVMWYEYMLYWYVFTHMCVCVCLWCGMNICCIGMYAHVCICGAVYVVWYVYAHVCEYGSQIGGECLPQSIFTLVLETRSLTEPATR